VAAALAAVVLGGCSSGSNVTDRSSSARTTLRQDVYTLTSLAHTGRYVDARAWVSQLHQDVMYARSSGALTVAQVSRIDALLDTVGADLAARIDRATPSSSSRSRAVQAAGPSHLGPTRTAARMVASPTDAAPAPPPASSPSPAPASSHKAASKSQPAPKHKPASKHKKPRKHQTWKHRRRHHHR
jgi:hypothetical protein